MADHFFKKKTKKKQRFLPLTSSQICSRHIQPQSQVHQRAWPSAGIYQVAFWVTPRKKFLISHFFFFWFSACRVLKGKTLYPFLDILKQLVLNLFVNQIKEVFRIEWENPALKRQLKRVFHCYSDFIVRFVNVFFRLVVFFLLLLHYFTCCYSVTL